MHLSPPMAVRGPRDVCPSSGPALTLGPDQPQPHPEGPAGELQSPVLGMDPAGPPSCLWPEHSCPLTLAVAHKQPTEAPGPELGLVSAVTRGQGQGSGALLNNHSLRKTGSSPSPSAATVHAWLHRNIRSQVSVPGQSHPHSHPGRTTQLQCHLPCECPSGAVTLPLPGRTLACTQRAPRSPSSGVR